MQLVRHGCALLVVISTGCGGDSGGTKPDAPGADPDEGAKSGMRVKLQWHDYGGTRVFAGLVDSTLGVPCQATRWSDGKTYCVPSNVAAVVYADMGCTQVVGQVFHAPSCAPPPPPTHLIESAMAGCDLVPAHLYRSGAQTAMAQFFQKDATGGCMGPFPSTNTDLYLGGAEVALSDLAGLSRDAPDGAGRLARQFLTSADGARIADVPRDNLLGTDCALRADAAGATTGTCAPVGGVPATFFHDTGCMQGELAQSAACARPAFAEQPAASGCPGAVPHYFTVGDLIASAPLFQQTTTGCRPTTPSALSAYYALGPQLSTAQLTRAYDPTPGRTAQLIHYSDGVSRFRDAVLYDSAHTTECRELKLADGSFRCIPQAGAVQSLFSDMACTQAIDVVSINTGPASCGAPTAPAFAIKNVALSAGACGSGTEVYATGAPYSGMLFQNPGCVSVDTTGAQVYRLGALHALTEFPQATVIGDP